jgi:hypothetical protein
MNETQAELILKHLKSGRVLTQGQALNLFGCFRLAPRIWELRQRGIRIDSKLRVLPSKKRIAVYSIAGH